MSPRPPRSTRTYTPLPYATLFRSGHPRQHVVVAPLLRPLGVRQRIAAGRELRDRGQRSHFVEVEFVELLAVVALRRRGDAVGAVAKERLIQVQLEALVLAQLALHLHRQQTFGELAGVGDLGAAEDLARDLLGEIGSA